MKSLYFTPLGKSFLQSFRGGWNARIQDIYHEKTKPGVLILFPHRRACQTFRQSFKPSPHVKIVSLADWTPHDLVDDDKLTNHEHVDVSEKKLIDPYHRKILLLQLVKKFLGHRSYRDETLLSLTGSLEALMDELALFRVPLHDLTDQLNHFSPSALSNHWKDHVQFLSMVLSAWPSILDEYHVQEAIPYRWKCLERVGYAWNKSPPTIPVIIAGSTGSHPQTRQLMKHVISLPKGMIVLPGVDVDFLKTQGAHELPVSHPQSGFQNLLRFMNITPNHLEPWDISLHHGDEHDHGDYSNEGDRRMSALRWAFTSPPSAQSGVQSDFSTKHWAQYVCDIRSQKKPSPFCSVNMYEFKTVHDHAAWIVDRYKYYKNQGLRGGVVTLDRSLAHHVHVQAKLRNLTIDDSMGQCLRHNPWVDFLMMFLDTAVEPTILQCLGLLKHPACRMSNQSELYEWEIHELRKKAKINDLNQYFKIKKQRSRSQTFESEQVAIPEWVQALQRDLGLLHPSKHDHALSWWHTHKAVVQSWYRDKPDDDWWKKHAENLEKSLNFLEHPQDYPWVLRTYFDQTHVYSSPVESEISPQQHPMLLLGPLESRLMDMDYIIVAELNQGVWPALPATDPWLPRSLRQNWGLMDHERQYGRSAHDLTQLFSVKNVYLTRSILQNGQITHPSAFWHRLRPFVGQDVSCQPTFTAGTDSSAILSYQPGAPPCPVPPVSARPRSLSVTQVESWMRDPYSIFVRHILHLRPLEPIVESNLLTIFGIVVHDVLDKIIQTSWDVFSEDTPIFCQEIVDQCLFRYAIPAQQKLLWWPRLRRMLDWWLEQERDRRRQFSIVQSFSEITGQMVIQGDWGDFTLTAKADRIDILADQRAILIDYKTGQLPSIKELTMGYAPQLPLEAAILRAGGFSGIPLDIQPCGLECWRITGGFPAGQRICFDQHMDEWMDQSLERLRVLIARFHSSETGYLSCPNPLHAPRYNDTTHLARMQEWHG